MAETRPRGEQLRFESTQTGSHVLDDYLEEAERGGRTLGDLMADIFDEDGNFVSDLFEFRVKPTTNEFQYRVGVFGDDSTGWEDTGDFFFRSRGAFANGTAYKRFDLVTHSGSLYVCLADHTSSTASPSASFAIMIDDALLDAATTAAAASASAAAASETAAETAETNAAASETAAAASEAAAAASETAAAASATAAATSETNAAASATTAQGHATSAQGYASDAQDSATAAALSETNAGNSETAAAASASAAAASAVDAEAVLDNSVRHDEAQALGAPAIAQALTNLGIASDLQSILGAADYAAVRALLQMEGARIRQIQHLISGTNGSTSTNTSYGGTLGSGQSVTPVSNTSKLLVIGFGSGTLTRANTGLFGSMRLHRYNGSAWVASSLGSLNVTFGENLGGTTSVDIRTPVVAISIFPQADINAGTGNWQIVFAGNVSTTGSSPLLELNNISYLMIELEGI